MRDSLRDFILHEGSHTLTKLLWCNHGIVMVHTSNTASVVRFGGHGEMSVASEKREEHCLLHSQLPMKTHNWHNM